MVIESLTYEPGHERIAGDAVKTLLNMAPMNEGIVAGPLDGNDHCNLRRFYARMGFLPVPGSNYMQSVLEPEDELLCCEETGCFYHAGAPGRLGN